MSDQEFQAVVDALTANMDRATRAEFGELEQMILRRSMEACGLTALPAVTGDPDGERCSGDCVCSTCGGVYFMHPPEWRVIGYGNVPFLNVLCDGSRVKL